MDKILEKITAFENALAKIERKRDLWITGTKAKIYSTLTEIKNIKDLDWKVQKIEFVRNSETVNLIFNRRPSGILQKDDNGFKHFEKQGGGLFFAQSYNGDIFIFMEYPFVKDYVGETEIKLFDKTSPENITEEYIIDKVSKFLEELTKWEVSTTYSSLGFK